MAYVNLESRIETALKTAIAAAIAASATLTGYGIAVRTFWTDDVAAADDTLVLPMIGIQADPNVPYGYRGTKRRVPVSILIATAQPEDRDRVILKAIYDAVREILDTSTITHSDIPAIAIEIADGGTVRADEDVNLVNLAVNAQIAAA